MRQFLQWLATVIIGVSFLVPFMLHPAIDTMLTMILGVIGLVLSVSTAWEEKRQLERQFEQERKERELQNQRLYDLTPQGRHDIARSKLLSSMHKEPKA